MARQPGPGPSAPTFELLTPREGEVFVLLASRLSNAEIAAELIIEASTVKTDVKRILTNLVRLDRLQAVIFADEHRVAPPRCRRFVPHCAGLITPLDGVLSLSKAFVKLHLPHLS